jgi:hypothetical protein
MAAANSAFGDGLADLDEHAAAMSQAAATAKRLRVPTVQRPYPASGGHSGGAVIELASRGESLTPGLSPFGSCPASRTGSRVSGHARQ